MASAKSMGFKELALAASLVSNVAMGGYLLSVQGSATVTNKVNFSTNASGAQLTVNGVTRYRQFAGTWTASGGFSTYTSGYVNPPFTSTGTLFGFGTECGAMAKAFTGDFSFKKDLTSASGSVFTNGDNRVIASGSTIWSMLAVPLAWNPADKLTFSTLVAPTGTVNTTRYDCQIWAIAGDKYGS